jgi:hypothetical protein
MDNKKKGVFFFAPFDDLEGVLSDAVGGIQIHQNTIPGGTLWDYLGG